MTHLSETLQHAAGAYARCSCGRYSLDQRTLTDRPPKCECGKQNHWCGAFVPPGQDAQWSGKGPETVENNTLTPEQLAMVDAGKSPVLSAAAHCDNELSFCIGWAETEKEAGILLMQSDLVEKESHIPGLPIHYLAPEAAPFPIAIGNINGIRASKADYIPNVTYYVINAFVPLYTSTRPRQAGQAE